MRPPWGFLSRPKVSGARPEGKRRERSGGWGTGEGMGASAELRVQHHIPNLI